MEENKIIPWNKETLSKLKSIEEIDKGIEEITSIENIDEYSYDELHSLFFRLFGIFPVPVVFFDKKSLDEIKLYRVRPYNDVPSNKTHNIGSFSCPSLNFDTGKTGRANWRGRNVFYGSDSPYTALLETKEVYKEKEYYVSKWGFNFKNLSRDKIQVSTLVFDNIPTDNVWGTVIPDIVKFERKLKKDYGVVYGERLCYLTRKVSQLFVDLKEHQYKITAFIADQRIFSKINSPNQIYFPLLIYPSIETNKTTCNFAIHPLFVENYMRLEEVIHIQVEDKKEKKIKINIVKNALVSEANMLKWYKMNLDPLKSVYRINSIMCGNCNLKIDTDKLDDIIFKSNNKIITHGEIVAKFLKDRNYSDFYDLENFFEFNGLIKGLNVIFKEIYLKNITATINNEDHTDLIIDLSVMQPYIFNEIT